ncbi:SpoIIE family protein phosphatase [Granulicella arctica]|uniref:SpoIIE family protein phosphatase n=1 Tax=Granulicella arctica TaxID=940613 RepID=UPI0021E02E92|nr:SpoIIE family protein phosphatase [Granulicella arctica]
MKSKSRLGSYVLLIVFAAISMTYYITGTIALREEFFHAGRYANDPFNFRDDGQTLQRLDKEAKAGGLSEGDFLIALDGTPFTGYAQIHDLLQRSSPGQTIEVSVRSPSGTTRTAHLQLAPREGPDWTIGKLLTFLIAILGVPLLSLFAGYWIVAALPRDLNAWLALLLLTLPETLYGNLDWRFWPHPWYLLLFLWNSIIQSAAFPAFLWFGFLFPERWRADLRFPWFKYLILAVGLCVSLLEIGFNAGQILSVNLIRPLMSLQVLADHVTASLEIVCVILFLVALIDKLRTASTADARRRLRVLAIGSALTLGPLLLIFAIAPLFGFDPHHGNWFVAIIPFDSFFPLTLAYVLIVQRAMDVRILLRMGTKYLLARATILVIEIAVVAFVIIHFIFPMMQRKQHQVLTFVLLAVCIGALFQVFLRRDGLSHRLQRWLDRRFFREAYNSEIVLSELSEQVRQLTDKDALVDTVLRRISEVLHVPQIAIMLRGTNTFYLQQSFGMDLDGGVSFTPQSATILNLERTNQPATLYRDRPEEWFTEADAGEQALLRQISVELLLPLSGRTRLLGLLALGSKRSEEAYTPTDLRILQSVAAQTGLTLEVAELVQTLASQASQRERMNREIEIAREVQQRLFPQIIPAIPGVSLAGMCRPASEVGGDYYDLIEMEDGNLGFTIGDVSGKGISAALIMASLRASLRGLILDTPDDLARMMQKVNRLVYEASSSSRYATFFFATFNPQTRELRYVNAGHNPPIVARAQSGKLDRLEACGPVVGLLPLVDYEAQSLILEAGDLLIAYTDGISEAMTADDEEWGETRMLEAAPGHTSASASEIIEHIFKAADQFTAGAEQHDDMTLLIMKLMDK